MRVRLALLFNPKAKFFYSLMMNAPNKNRLHHFWIYRRLDYLFSSSKTIVEQVKNNFPVRESTPQWLPYGRSITEESFSSSEIDGLRSRYGVTTETFVVGTLCRIDRGKGVLELAGALKHLPQSILEKIQIWIIGDPTVKSTIDNRVVYEEDAEKVYNELLKIKKSFPNQLQLIPYQKKAGLFLKSMDAFVLASHNETYSLSVLEAMIYEVLILGSRSGGTIEQIGFDELRGCFFEPRSELSIASQIEKVMSSPELREKKIKEAKKWVTENHSWSNNLKMFRELLAKKQIYV
jgi:glycosyltransferase involved in cell wall biosynthesis